VLRHGTHGHCDAYAPERVEGQFSEVLVQGPCIAEACTWTEDASLGAELGRVRLEYSDRGTMR
jgi:hypothetical protein